MLVTTQKSILVGVFYFLLDLFVRICLLLLDLFVGYDYYGDEKEVVVDERTDTKEMKIGDEGITTVVPNSTSTPMYEFLLKQIRDLHSSMAGLQDMIKQLVFETKRRSEDTPKNMSDSGNASVKVSTELEKFEKHNIDIEKLLVIDSDFDDFPTFNMTDVAIYVKRLSIFSWFDSVSTLLNEQVGKMTAFLKHAYSNVSTAIWFSLFLFGCVFFLVGIIFFCCKLCCCQHCCCKRNFKNRDYDIEALPNPDTYVGNISEPLLWYATNTQPLVHLSDATGSAFPIPKKLERSASLNSKFRHPPSFLSFGIPPPMAPIRTTSLPSSPILRKRKNVTFNFDTPYSCGKEETIEIKETTV